MDRRRTTKEGTAVIVSLPIGSDEIGKTARLTSSIGALVRSQDDKEQLCGDRDKLKRQLRTREEDIFWRYRKNHSNWLGQHKSLAS